MTDRRRWFPLSLSCKTLVLTLSVGIKNITSNVDQTLISRTSACYVASSNIIIGIEIIIIWRRNVVEEEGKNVKITLFHRQVSRLLMSSLPLLIPRLSSRSLNAVNFERMASSMKWLPRVTKMPEKRSRSYLAFIWSLLKEPFLKCLSRPSKQLMRGRREGNLKMWSKHRQS